MKSFFKSDWFKCTAILLIIAVVLSATLAILNDVLYVSPAERTGRAIKKIYGEEKNFELEFDETTQKIADMCNLAQAIFDFPGLRQSFHLMVTTQTNRRN